MLDNYNVGMLILCRLINGKVNQMNNNKWKLTSTFVDDKGKLRGIYSHIDNSKKIDQFLEKYDYKNNKWKV